MPALTGGLHEVKLENGASLKARTVILSTGARWLKARGEHLAHAGAPQPEGPERRRDRLAPRAVVDADDLVAV